MNMRDSEFDDLTPFDPGDAFTFSEAQESQPPYAVGMAAQTFGPRSGELESERASLVSWMPESSPLSDPGNWQAFFGRVASERQAGRVPAEDLRKLRTLPRAALGRNTVQGRALAMAHGGVHRFEVLDDIFSECIGDDTAAAIWDHYFQAQGFAQAIRHRRALLQQVLRDVMEWGRGRQLQILSLGCGASRDVASFLRAFPQAPVQFTCVDADAKALERAASVCAPWTHQVRFHKGNALQLRVNPQLKFDLVWCVGLMENLDDRSFISLLTRMLGMARPDMGLVVLDNLSPPPPEMAYMSWLDWKVINRSGAQLSQLATVCGAPELNQTVQSGPQGASQVLRISVGL